MQALSALFRLLDDPDALGALAPALVAPPPLAPDAAPIDRVDRSALATRGVVSVRRAASAPHVLVEAVASITSHGLPAVAIYAFPHLWGVGQGLATRLSTIAPYVLVEDFWAWRIPPGARGWPAHRGLPTVLDREAPELLNAWIALSDVEPDRACMHFVALGDDPHYPANLDIAPETSGEALPLAAGDALVFNANILHWGGENRRAPRTSASFSFCRQDALESLAMRRVMGVPDFATRIAMVASQIVVYGGDQSDVSDAMRGWANATVQLTKSVHP